MAKIKHIVLLKFKEDAGPEQIEGAFENILDITETIPGIEDYVSGPNSSSEGLSQGYTHGLIMTFTDSAARDAYLTHPEHEGVKQLLSAMVDAMLVVDFEV